MSKLSALIIDRDPESLEIVAGYLKEMDIDQILKASDLRSGDSMLSRYRPTVALFVIVEMKLSDKGNILAFVESVKKKYPNTAVFITCDQKDSDLILDAMRAGADDYLLKPINKMELARAIEKVTMQVIVRRSVPETVAAVGKVIAVLGSKDGYGKTTVAVNLAALMARDKKRPVMIMDLDLQGGDVSTFLNIKPNYTIADVARNVNRIDANYVKGAMYRHESGIYVLAEPKNVADAEEITGGLGPEPLSAEFTAQWLAKALHGRHRQIKPLLLDQTFLAGLGNIYADEALNLAKLHPLTPADTLTFEQAERLLESIRRVLKDGIQRNGASIDWVYRGGDFQNYFRVYQRTGEPCPVCGTPIARIVVGQRGTHYCPHCQVLTLADGG